MEKINWRYISDDIRNALEHFPDRSLLSSFERLYYDQLDALSDFAFYMDRFGEYDYYGALVNKYVYNK